MSDLPSPSKSPATGALGVKVATRLYPVLASKMGRPLWSTLFNGRAYAGCDASDGAGSAINIDTEIGPATSFVGKVQSNAKVVGVGFDADASVRRSRTETGTGMRAIAVPLWVSTSVTGRCRTTRP